MPSSALRLCAVTLLLAASGSILWFFSDHVKKRRRPHKEIFISADCWLEVFHFLAPSQLGLEIALISRRFDLRVDEHFKTRKRIRIIWICADVWMDILPFFERAELGLALALLSPRFDALVDKHFDGKSELTIWRTIIIYKELARPKATLSVWIGGNSVDFPWPDRPLPNKIRFKYIRIDYIDHSVIEFVRSNKHIWDRSGTDLELYVYSDEPENDVQPIWDFFVRQIWPIFTTTNMHHLGFDNADHLDALLRLTSPTILLDLNINSIESGRLFPEAIVDFDGPTNATPTAGQVLSKWLHKPRTDGRPKKLRCLSRLYQQTNLEWINSFKETFLRATTSVSYKVNLVLANSTPIEPFELENERTKEKLTLEQVTGHPAKFLLKRCPINGETAAVKWENGENLDANLNKVYFVLYDNNCIGPLSPPTEEEKEKADQSMENDV